MAAEGGDVIPEATIQEVLRHAMVVDGLSRGLREAVKALDKRGAQLAILAKNCDEPAYLALVRALCKEHNIDCLEVPDSKQLGEWSGLCKYDREGKPRKVVSCSCVVIRDFGTKSQALEDLLAAVRRK